MGDYVPRFASVADRRSANWIYEVECQLRKREDHTAPHKKLICFANRRALGAETV